MRLTPGDLASLRATQEAAMLDTCQRFAYGQTGTDPLGGPIYGYTATGGVLPCGYDSRPPRELMGMAQYASVDGTLRLPIGTVVDVRDRLRLLSRFGEALTTTLDFEVIGPPRLGPSGLQVYVQQVTLPE